MLYLIGRLGAAAGAGSAVEFAGPTIRSLSMEARLSLCNLSIEMGARFGMIAPDDTTLEYLAGREFAPKGALWDQAVAHWRTLPSDDGCVFDREESVDIGAIAPQITWGTSPQDVVGIDGAIPDPTAASRLVAALRDGDGARLHGARAAETDRRHADRPRLHRILHQQPHRGPAPGGGHRPRPACRCARDRLGGARILQRHEGRRGRRTRSVFRAAGFDWREPGCSQCAAANGEIVAPGERIVSTSNRNFVGRQGPGARTHLASPAMAAASAIAGSITDPRRLA